VMVQMATVVEEGGPTSHHTNGPARSKQGAGTELRQQHQGQTVRPQTLPALLRHYHLGRDPILLIINLTSCSDSASAIWSSKSSSCSC
jgi:hypothetical protein